MARETFYLCIFIDYISSFENCLFSSFARSFAYPWISFRAFNFVSSLKIVHINILLGIQGADILPVFIFTVLSYWTLEFFVSVCWSIVFMLLYSSPEVSGLTLRLWSISNWFLSRVREWNLVVVFYLWMSSFPSTICWKGCLFQYVLLRLWSKIGAQ